MTLGVNIDHIAVLREARKINDPDPLMALAICAQSGADQITIHLREDRRHIHDEDARRIVAASALPVNLECAIEPSIIDIVCALRPHRATLVPEKREEVTTEGGLDVTGNYQSILDAIKKLNTAEVEVSLFIDPTREAIEASERLGAQWVELHTGSYANLYAMRHSALPHTHHAIESLNLSRRELDSLLENAYGALVDAANYARSLGLKVAAGHGLNYQNIAPIVNIDTIEELNIGQSIIARSVFTGLATAVSDMKALCQR
ncbi:MAG: pyridoxine 5'-phosphate synthase [Sulfuricurvum sp.]|uniref:pyridoxine 5'-phosphate synthase n=1 Tax=Sulfuricurvum sp. TaxID=2025608 RepID=UPI0027353B51|nr:pyridoxine 5'-phosphate synthase [Sulfuricurvum sp.]MDP2851356.1 pyridoxine 5'-phosphate synthase [Sulfuricurvum sp.]MDP3292271.1 pyridoxine 5'-phosphate synthase [Sulfuricurvum sp.]